MAWFDRSPGGKKSPEEDRPVTQPDTAQPAAPEPKVEAPPPQPSAGELVAYLYKGSRVTGQLTFHGHAKIDGNVEGEIQCRKTLTIGEGAEVRAKISGEVVVIHGRVEGNVTARQKIELVAPARLHGNVDSPRLIITEGVVFEGDCSMGRAREKGGVASSQSVSAEMASGAKAPKLNTDSEK